MGFSSMVCTCSQIDSRGTSARVLFGSTQSWLAWKGCDGSEFLLQCGYTCEFAENKMLHLLVFFFLPFPFYMLMYCFKGRDQLQ